MEDPSVGAEVQCSERMWANCNSSPVISAEGPTGTEATETLSPTRSDCLGSWDLVSQIANQFWLLVLSLIRKLQPPL